MKAKDLMSVPALSLSATSSLLEAAQEMKKYDIGALPIITEHTVIGIVTDRDIITRAVAKERDLKLTEVHEIMTPHVHVCFVDDDVTEAARIMAQYQIRRLPVMDDDEVVGMLSLGDIARNMPALAGETLCGVSQVRRDATT